MCHLLNPAWNGALALCSKFFRLRPNCKKELSYIYWSPSISLIILPVNILQGLSRFGNWAHVNFRGLSFSQNDWQTRASKVKVFETLLFLVKFFQPEVNKHREKVKQLYLLQLNPSSYCQEFQFFQLKVKTKFPHISVWISVIGGLCLSNVSGHKMTFYNWKIARLKFQCDLNTLFSESQGVGCRIVFPWHSFWYLFSLRQVVVF